MSIEKIIDELYEKYLSELDENTRIISSGLNINYGSTFEDLKTYGIIHKNPAFVKNLTERISEIIKGDIPNSIQDILYDFENSSKKIDEYDIDFLKKTIVEFVKQNTESEKKAHDNIAKSTSKQSEQNSSEFDSSFFDKLNDCLIYNMYCDSLGQETKIPTIALKNIHQLYLKSGDNGVMFKGKFFNKEKLNNFISNYITEHQLNIKALLLKTLDERFIKSENKDEKNVNKMEAIISILKDTSQLPDKLDSYALDKNAPFFSSNGNKINDSEHYFGIVFHGALESLSWHKIFIKNLIYLSEELEKSQSQKNPQLENLTKKLTEYFDSHFANKKYASDDKLLILLEDCEKILQQYKEELSKNTTKQSEGNPDNKDKENDESSIIQDIDKPNKLDNEEPDTNKDLLSENTITENKSNDKSETLRSKFNIEDEQDFNKLLVYYAQLNKSYYSNSGKKHTEEEIKRRKNVNAQLKRILNKKAKEMPKNETGEDFSKTITSIENGEMFSYDHLKEVASDKKACLKLFEIMTSGVYEKDGQRIRLTQKQRIALASTLEIVSGLRLDMINSKTNKQSNIVSNESTNIPVFGA